MEKIYLLLLPREFDKGSQLVITLEHNGKIIISFKKQDTNYCLYYKKKDSICLPSGDS